MNAQAKLAIFFSLTLLGIVGCQDHADQFGQNNPMPQIGNNSVYSNLFNQVSGVGQNAAVSRFLTTYHEREKEKYTFVIFTDESSGAKAREAQQKIQAQPPFSLFELTFLIEIVSSAKLGCYRDKDIDRLLLVDTKFVTRRTAELGADQAMAICDTHFGGSGGNVPVASTGGGDVGKVLLHEFLHTLGFADEYAYSKSEAKSFCNPRTPKVNLAYINPNNPYASDQAARSAHQSAIPWYSQILDRTLITHDRQLGTGTPARNVLGLFPAKTCEKADLHTWKPGEAESVMEDENNDLDAAYQTLVFEILIAKGLPLKTVQGEEVTNPIIHDGPRPSDAGIPNGMVTTPGSAVSR
ncbi:MAG: hypothetical protein HYV97_09975 [Bdellovibrio sp.]|nr:hypothetical protein [Bdellovibrio sp.]